MKGIELMATKAKFKKIQRVNSELFYLVHELSDEEYKLFLESEYVWPIDTMRIKNLFKAPPVTAEQSKDGEKIE